MVVYYAIAQDLSWRSRRDFKTQCKIFQTATFANPRSNGDRKSRPKCNVALLLRKASSSL